jgi:tripartite-type tricarboxylate transporter receptor subunit TctC
MRLIVASFGPGGTKSMKMLRIAVVLASAVLAVGHAFAQSWPTKPVKIIVPFAAGGPADIYARVLGEKLQAALGQSFVIDDRPGGGSIVGTDAAAKAAPDGYTLLMMSNTHTVNESLIPDRPFQLLRDFVPVAPVNYSDLVLVVHPSVPANTLREFIALAKSQPGKLNYASSGPGTPYHMAGELFKAMANVDIVHVPYKGSSGARTDILGGQVQMMFDAITTMAPNVRAGKLKALATSGKVRSAVLPEVPTMSQAGVPGYDAVIWLGIMAPAGTPRAIVEKLNAAITRVVNAPDTKAAWAQQGAVPMSMTPVEFGKYIRDDIDKWARIVKLSGAKPDQ